MKIAKIQTNTKNFFYHWVSFTKPFHNLGKTEGNILAELLYYRYLLSHEVSSEKLLDKLTFDLDTKKKICKNLGLPQYRMAMVLTDLRKQGIVIKQTINPKFIPDLSIGDKEFVLAFKFDITDNEEGVYSKKGRKKTKKISK